jgi:nucleotide-binding universal stress UspA family protein
MPDFRPYRRILALIRFDAMDGATAEKALMLARMNQAQLDFLHLIEPDGTLDGGYPGSTRQATVRDLEHASLRRLDFLAARLGAGEARCHAIYGPLRQGFQRHVRESQPDLIVTGEQAAYLAGSHDVLVLSAARRPQRGRLLTTLMNLLGLRPRDAGVRTLVR